MVSLRAPTRRLSLPEVDPDLVKGLDPASLNRLRKAATADVIDVDFGPWPTGNKPPQPLYGLFVIDGILSRGVVIQGRRSAELLGPGDILRPAASEGLDPSVKFSVAWEMLDPGSLALLDARFAEAVAPWPQFVSALMDRIGRRAHALAFHLAVTHLKLVETRLLVILWYYADRWGRVTSEGVLLPLRLTHGLLARIVGARRPSVSTALGRLQERGLLERTEVGHWLLRGDPPTELAGISPGSVAESQGG